MDIICPRCKTSKYRNPAVRFMVNVCGHSLCTNCVELQYNRGSGNCEVCRIILKKNNFRPQMFLSAEVERGVFIRKRILKDFNKTLKDFKTDHEYNDYLEEVETIIYNLSHGIDVEAMNARVDKYKAENEEVLKDIKNFHSNNSLGALEGELIGKDEENLSGVQDKIDTEVEDETVKRNNERPDTGSGTASSGLTGGAYQYKQLNIDNEGPEPPQSHLLNELGYLNSLARGSTDAELGGGFSLEVACHKSLCYAMTGLYVLEGLRPKNYV